MSNKMQLITNADALAKLLVKINKDANSLVDQIQTALGSAIYFAVKDGNVTPLNGLLVAVGKGVRKTAIANWAIKFGPVVLNDNKEQAKEQPFKFSKDKLEAIMASHVEDRPVVAEMHATTALATYWTEYKEPPLVPEEWSFIDGLKKLMAQAKSLEGKGTKVSGMEMINQIADLIPARQDATPTT